ncbi:hypothetical protein CSA17_02325 [bacterium DOLJORAL78_65_58]|nr:MAG: hypothetical protein CSB20_10040 [bacterium DOLZORAL124_64_63]PIE76417.1 MAG: hypothetical protein CSA17_02325 [bacterium DOLJORAL78_65_58]
MKRILSILFLTLLWVGGALASDLPSAESIIDKFIEASGGKAAMAKYKTAHATGTFSIPAMGLTADLEIWKQAPDLSCSRMVSETLGTISEGYNGEVAWEISMMTGTKVKEGVELAAARREAEFSIWLRWKDFYQKAETLGSDEVDGVDCWKVRMTPNEGEGEPEIQWFAKDSGLALKSVTTMKSEMGEMSVEAYILDYQEVQGLVLPMKSRQVLMGMQEMVMEMKKFEFGVEIPAGTFDLPQEVQALVDAGQ